MQIGQNVVEFSSWKSSMNSKRASKKLMKVTCLFKSIFKAKNI